MIARRIFAERGYTSTSMRDIAEASGLMAGSLYSHFRSKAEILRLVVAPMLDELVPGQESVLASGGSGLARFERMVREVLAVLAGHREETVILHYDWSGISEIPELADVAERSNHLLDLWADVIAAGQADGSIRPDVRPELVVRAVTSALHATVDTKRYGARPLPDAAGMAAELADELTSLFAAGIGSPPSAARRSTTRPAGPPAPRRGPR